MERERQLELMRQEQNEERRREREQAAKAQEQMMHQLQQDLCCLWHFGADGTQGCGYHVGVEGRKWY